MLYCEKCSLLSEGDRCDACGALLREPRADDFCLLTECEELFGESFAQSLREEGIACAARPVGDGYRSYLGLSLGARALYVPYCDYERASGMLSFFAEDLSLESLREKLLQNTDKWHIVKASTVKKIRKRLKLPPDADVMVGIKDFVTRAQSISDRGVMYCFYGQHGLAVLLDGVTLWFSADGYEIVL